MTQRDVSNRELTLRDSQQIEIVPVNVLLVDDRPEDLAAMATVLARPGFTLITAGSGAEALRKVLADDFAVILLDVRMPIMDGFEVAALIKQRERSQHTPIIFLTAAGDDVTQIYRGYSAGAVDYLAKPVDPDVLAAKVGIFADLFRKDKRLKQQSEALRAAERRERDVQMAELRIAADRRYKNLAEAIPVIVWTGTADGKIDYTNRRWHEYTGLDLDHARGDGWLSALHPEDRAACEEAWRAVVAKPGVWEAECRRARGADGAYRWHVARAEPELGPDGAVIGWIGTFVDVEVQKQAIHARDEFLSIASHELRTPLTALKLRVQGLQRLKGLDEKQMRNVDRAVRQTDRMERLIDNLLDVSRITTGHLEIEPEEVDLIDVVNELVERMREEALRAGSPMNIEAPPTLLGRWDRLRLEQVVTNLISNATKYGGGKPISITVVASEQTAILSVKDEGIGVGKEDAERIFEQFERTESARRHGGLGMGLYITRQIVEAHGGTIKVDSSINVGSVFTIELPREGAPSSRAARQSGGGAP